MNVKLEITSPIGEVGFIEYKRAFVVEGIINSDDIIDDDCELTINIYNSNNEIVRYVICDKKNKNIFAYHPDLVTYSEDDDKGRKKLQEYGFPLLIVDDINNPYESLNNATIKAWYNDDSFKAIITNASDIKHGALVNDGMNLVDENGNPYSLLEKGEYRIEVILQKKGKFICKEYKNIVIGKRDIQFIGRFNPNNHKLRMIDWCKKMNISLINDIQPGYLDSYLGNWEYHKGLLTMYRANDICLYEDVKVVLFDYLIDETSSSYATELSYLQANNKVNDIDVYYYDIGEASISNSIANTLKFNKDEYGKLLRIDLINDYECENRYYLDRRYVVDSFFDLNDIEINHNDCIAIMGVIKPIQLDPNDFILKKDNTYEVNNYPRIIRYHFNDETIDRRLNMERIDKKSIGKSIYEFYNVFSFDNKYSNTTVNVNVECIYAKGDKVDIGSFMMRIK